MKKILLTLLMVPFALACSNKNSGTKIKLEKVDNPGLEIVDGKHMYDNAFTEKKNSIYYIGDNTCSACITLKQELDAWCTKNSARIYEIEYTNITEQDQKYIEDSTVGQYGWSTESTLPSVYFFMMGEVVGLGDSSTTMNKLNKFVEVI